MNKKTVFLLLAVMALAAFFRLWDLDSVPPGLYPDEAMNGSNAQEALYVGDFSAFYPENNGREGLFINIQALSVYVFGNEPWALRLVSAVFGILTVLGVFMLSRALFHDNKLALWAAFFIAISFWHINFSRIGFRAITAPLFLTWSLYFLWSLFDKEKSLVARTSLAALGGLAFGLGFNSYIAYRAAPALLLIPFIKWWKVRRERDLPEGCMICHFTLFCFFALLAVIPLGVYFLENPADFFGRTAQISVFSADQPLKMLFENTVKTLGMFWVAGDYNWRHNFSGSPELWWPVGILFAWGLVVALRRRSLEDNLLLFWVALMLLPVVISSEGIPHALRAIIVIPPVMILAGSGMSDILARARRFVEEQKIKYPERAPALTRLKKEFTALGIVFILSCITFAYVQYFVRWGSDINTYYAFAGGYHDIAKWLNTLPADTNKYVVVNATGVDVRGVPMPAQTVMFLTDSFVPQKRAAKNIIYLLPDELNKISCLASCVVVALDSDALLYARIKEKNPELILDISPGFAVLKK